MNKNIYKEFIKYRKEIIIMIVIIFIITFALSYKIYKNCQKKKERFLGLLLGLAAGGVMGGLLGKSKHTISVDINNKQLIVNKDTIKLIAKNINTSITNIIQTTTKKCEVSASSSQLVNNKFGSISGNYNSGDVTMEMSGKVDMKCLQDSNIRTDIINEVAQQMTNSIKTNMKTDAFAALESNAQLQEKTGFLAMPPLGDKKVDTKITNDLTQKNISSKTLTNIIVNHTANNFKNENIQNCILTIKYEQTRREGADSVAGNVNISATNMKMTQDAVLQCFQIDKNVKEILDKTAATMGLELVTDQSATSKVSLKGKSTMKLESRGLDDLMGKLMWPMIISVIGSIIVSSSIAGIFLSSMKSEKNVKQFKKLFKHI